MIPLIHIIHHIIDLDIIHHIIDLDIIHHIIDLDNSYKVAICSLIFTCWCILNRIYFIPVFFALKPLL